ncbi:MAG: DUF2892 domain-containing protein [Gemmatimonadota bacterium]|jgi:ABC-type polysaccharide/polyol phosphate export permease|nr:DUF2892 domain-containing protein [Gemmatimonadota bacterium]MDQ8147592.1 DUF2892 domain-containing protein [Gemmatimonadota bacterium]MDQ8149484.1 DUF2892 domain-containing protein [Gemmatimonadota bacterium]MDQ8157108.1 DUF2892 domain-containing protein [Gemmatimonadota bacterium]MDQ8177181.1 DUF2892 domain-containing protein [Gemmatimonadota bacterium]
MFPRNEGPADRIIRLLLGLVIVTLVFVGPKTPWGWLGLIPIATALFGFCPVYALLGIRTCPAPKAP